MSSETLSESFQNLYVSTPIKKSSLFTPVKIKKQQQEEVNSTPLTIGAKYTPISFAQKCYAIFNKEVFNNTLPKDLVICYNKSLRTTAGSAVFKNGKPDRIELSTKVVGQYPERIRKTLLHECCHIAQFIEGVIVLGMTMKDIPPHGELFKKYSVMASEKYPELIVTTCHNYDIDYKYVGQCIHCHYSFKRHSKPKQCKNCGIDGDFWDSI